MSNHDEQTPQHLEAQSVAEAVVDVSGTARLHAMAFQDQIAGQNRQRPSFAVGVAMGLGFLIAIGMRRR